MSDILSQRQGQWLRWEPCREDETPYPWTRQIESIHIDVEDAVSDDGQEVFNLLQDCGINDITRGEIQLIRSWNDNLRRRTLKDSGR